MLQLILGRCKSGKSEKIRDIIAKKIENGKDKIILIVPEQSSFENEKKMLEVFGNKNFSKIRVLSFSRLYDFVSQVLNIPTIKSPSEMAQIVMMNASLENVRSKLKLYKKNSGDIEVANLMLKTVKELKMSKIDFDVLSKIELLTDNDILKQKISEIKIIIQSYEDITKSRFLNSYDELTELEIVIRKNKVFEEYDIFFDEFSSFTSQQLSILEIIFQQAENIYMSFCCDEDYKNTDTKNLFACVSKTIIKIEKIASKYNLKVNLPLLLHTDEINEFNDLKILEKNVFRPIKSISNSIPEKVKIYNALNQNEECEYVAQTIKKLIIEENYRYSDFVVVARDISNYVETFKSTFRKYDLPYFLNSTDKIFNKSVINFIFSAFDLIISNFSSGDMFRFLKSGLMGLSIEQISLLENYVMLWGISGQSWFEEFTSHPGGLGKSFGEEDKSKLEEINILRQKIVSPLKNFKENIKNTNGKKISQGVYKLLVEMDVPENLRKFCKKLMENGQYITAEQESAAWDYAMDMLGEMAKTFEFVKISPTRYEDVLFSVANCINFSFVPQNLDNIIIGDANKIRVSNPKIVFIIGAVNGEFPRVPESSEIFTDTELEHIASLGIEICDDNETIFMQERFLAYIAMSNAKEKLFISWSSANLSGKSKLPSEIIKEVKTIFPKIKISNRHSFNPIDNIFSYKSALEILAKNVNNKSACVNELKRYFRSNTKLSSKYEPLVRISNKHVIKFENVDNAKKLFENNLKISASQIEKYYTCRFEYFCEYVLKAKAFKPARFGALEYGNIVHFLFEKLFKRYPERKIADVSLEILKSEINEIIDDYISEKLDSMDVKNERFKYTIKRLKSSLSFLMERFVDEFKQSRFDIYDTELEIARNGKIKPLIINLSDSEKVIIEGKIDRVDVMKSENGNYVRIIDYKTGAKEFKLSDVLYGLNMQMLVYLIAIQKNASKEYGNIIPAGVLYFTALKPLIDALNKSDLTNISSQIFKKMRMNGLILDDINVIAGMEEDGKGVFVPAEIKNGDVKKSQSVTSLKELKIIENHVESLVKKMAIDLKNGEVSANPIYKGHTACEWCDYFPVCRYEDDNFIDIPTSMTNKQVIEEMSREAQKNNG